MSANARRAASDPNAIGVIGGYASGAGAVAVPILNEAGVPVISPTSTAPGLTIGGPGTQPGDPFRLYGTGLARRVRRQAAGRGIQLVATRHLRRQRDYRALGRTLRAKDAQCVVYTGVTADGAVAVFRDVGRALPHAWLFGSDGIAEGGFARRIPRGVSRRTHVTVSTLAPSAYPADGQRVIKRYGDPYARPTATRRCGSTSTPSEPSARSART